MATYRSKVSKKSTVTFPRKSQYVVYEAPKPRLTNPSNYQKIIFSAVEEAGKQALINLLSCNEKIIALHVDALAGTGKTTTSVEKDYYLPIELRNDSVQVAFNSDIAGTLRNRVANGVEAKTLHALGRTALVKAFPDLNNPRSLDSRKYLGYIRAAIGDESETQETREGLATIIDRARDCMAWTAIEMVELLDRFDIQTGNLSEGEFLAIAEKVLKAGLIDTMRMDYGDMIAMPLYHNLTFRQYSAISVDEAQDLCPSQHELIRRSLKPGGLLVSVGDENQAIYMWRGADPDSINRMVNQFGSTRYTLPCTYRCGRAIVASAQEIVPALECPEQTHQGEVIDLPIEKMLETIKPGDALLSRLNAPLVKFCFAMIRAGIPANIQGRDVADNLIGMIKRSKTSTVDQLLDWIEQWREIEIARRTKQKRSTTSIEDQAECLITLCEGCLEIKEVISRIEEMFPKDMPEKVVLCSSTHRAKGKEWKRVFVLEDTFMLKNGNPKEERNLIYVARTRAMQTLFKVHGR